MAARMPTTNSSLWLHITYAVDNALAGSAITAVAVLLELDSFSGWPWMSSSSAVESPFDLMLYTAIFIACISIGASVAAFTQFWTVASDIVRIARTAVPQTRRLHKWCLELAPFGFVAAALFGYTDSLIWPGTASADQPAATFAPIFVEASLLAVVAADMMLRNLLCALQPATTPEELVWDDSLRAQALRELRMASLALGTEATVCVIGLSSRPADVPADYTHRFLAPDIDDRQSQTSFPRTLDLAEAQHGDIRSRSRGALMPLIDTKSASPPYE